ncbi:hypothetical protein BAE44_0023715 [Dichanthelium oligosanthes]|uniref:Uncharacterized protein n=1 Tax=Dichanthelium oligosanthes TaxID=888268 RepID=A0A1E5UR34_9POAL|nr:hypothetical protein BAE44_0023715 [Dichanthelium oligosanthes]
MMAVAGHKSNTTATLLLLLLLPLMLSTASEAARHRARGKWKPPIVYPTPPWEPLIIYPSPIKPPPRSGHVDMDLPSVDEQAPPALPEDPAGLSSAPRKP